MFASLNFFFISMLITEGGKLLRCSVAGRCWERLVLLRPLRSEERLRELPEVPPGGTTAPALAPFPRRLEQLYKGPPKYCFAFQKGSCHHGEQCSYVHQIAPGG